MSANQGTDVPGGVTVVAMLAIVIGIVELFAGVVMIVFSGDVSGFRAIYDVVWLLVLGLDGIGIATLIALAINLLVFAALWSGRAAFGASGPDTPQPA